MLMAYPEPRAGLGGTSLLIISALTTRGERSIVVKGLPQYLDPEESTESTTKNWSPDGGTCQ